MDSEHHRGLDRKEADTYEANGERHGRYKKRSAMLRERGRERVV